MNITKIISKVFDSRLKAIDLYDTQAGNTTPGIDSSGETSRKYRMGKEVRL